jgi:hypothetical protein
MKEVTRVSGFFFLNAMPATTPAAQTTQQKVDALFKWFQDHDITYNKDLIQIHSDPFFVTANEDIPLGTLDS